MTTAANGMGDDQAPDRAMRAALDALGTDVTAMLHDAHDARERALAACRTVIRSAGLAIRAVHSDDRDERTARLAEAEEALRGAQASLAPFPYVAHAGFLHDAEKELAEAHLTAAFCDGTALPDHAALGVGVAAWCNGLAEAASELRRRVLDLCRADDLDEAQRLFACMDAAFGMLATITYPDAITGGLRRSCDALRAVVERTRADLTTTLVQARLRQAIEEAGRGG